MDRVVLCVHLFMESDSDQILGCFFSAIVSMNMVGYFGSEYKVINGFKVLAKFVKSLLRERDKPYKCYYTLQIYANELIS